MSLKLASWSSPHGAAEMNPIRNHEVAVQSLASLTALRIWHCPELWCRSQRRLGSDVAVAVAWLQLCVAPIRPLTWELPYAMSVAIKKIKKSGLQKLIFFFPFFGPLWHMEVPGKGIKSNLSRGAVTKDTAAATLDFEPTVPGAGESNQHLHRDNLDH